MNKYSMIYKYFLYFNLLFLAIGIKITHAQEKLSAKEIDFYKEVIIFRHGYSQHNTKGQFNANPFHPKYVHSFLTDDGKIKVRQQANKLIKLGLNANNIDRMYTSPLLRTQETGQILVQEGLVSWKNSQTNNLLIEMQSGDLEGVSVKEYRSKGIPWPGETYANANARINKFIHDFIINSTDKRIVIVTHAQLAKILVEKLSNKESTPPLPGDYSLLKLNYIKLPLKESFLK